MSRFVRILLAAGLLWLSGCATPKDEFGNERVSNIGWNSPREGWEGAGPFGGLLPGGER